jgi:prolyl-tRNA editing enzyme YbaK/EbsC (Cys-tRNA(Pro) deacylase)
MVPSRALPGSIGGSTGDQPDAAGTSVTDAERARRADSPSMVGTLDWTPALDRPGLLAAPVAAALAALPDAGAVLVAEIDPELADTAAFCTAYDVGLDVSANCVVLTTRRSGEAQLAACVVLATTRADVNGVARRTLGARKASFAPMDAALAETGMEPGGITPVGLPPAWPLLVDGAVAAGDRVVVGSGVRRSKLLLPGSALASLPGAEVVDGLGVAAAGG